jgi:hypothetical protein
MKKTINRTVIVKTCVSFSAVQLRKLLKLPEDARVFVRVPGGGDWSNQDLEIDDDIDGVTQLEVEYTRTTRK